MRRRGRSGALLFTIAGLCGCASEPAGFDSNRDSLLATVYAGTPSPEDFCTPGMLEQTGTTLAACLERAPSASDECRVELAAALPRRLDRSDQGFALTAPVICRMKKVARDPYDASDHRRQHREIAERLRR